MKTTLMRLQEKTKTLRSPKHQFYNWPLQARRYYAAGILLQTQLSDSVNVVDHFELLRFLSFAMHFQREDVIAVMELAKDKENVLNQILALLDSKEKQMVFLLDLYNVSFNGKIFGEKECQAITIYSELFQIDRMDLVLLKRFMESAVKRDTAQCMQIFSNIMQADIPCTLECLRYYIPELEYVTVVDTDTVMPGDTILLTGNCEIRKTLTIPAGCQLRIRSAQVALYSQIIVNGGELTVEDSELHYISGTYSFMIRDTGKGTAQFENTCFYCGNQCGAISKTEGRLALDHCYLYDSNAPAGIQFGGADAQITNCSFSKCFSMENGAALQLRKGPGNVCGCRFRNCVAENGGAICANEQIHISKCQFIDCHAKKLGNSVYYIGFAQDQVTECQYENKTSEQAQVVQYLNRPEQLENVTEISISTYLDMKWHVQRKQECYIHDAILYIACPVRVEGQLRLERVLVKPYSFIGKDVLDVTNASTFTITDCWFDGAQKYGIIRATGTRVEIKKTVFQDAAKGRAIYDAVELMAEDCVFSNCMAGAIYGTRVVLRRCDFINCRGKRGAGIYLTGNKGLIKQCHFERCIALIDGGAIAASGNYQIVDCTFTECEPNNVD